MGREAIERILDERRQTPASTPGEEKQENKFFSILGGEGLHEDFLELQLSNGNCTCFNYTDLQWFNYDPKAGCIDLEFGGYLITIKGRGLKPKLWQGLKGKRVAWVKERDTDMQDNSHNECFIEEILITPPSSAEESGAQSGD